MEQNGDDKKKKSWKSVYIGIGAVACLCLIIGGIFGGRFLVKSVVKHADDGLSDQKNKKSSHSATLDADEPETGLVAATDYEELFEYLKTQNQEEMTTYESSDTANVMTSGVEQAAAGTTKVAADDAGGYSDTNVRAEGVKEADTVKTDGNYIYSLKDGMYLQIVDVRNPEMKVASTIDLSDDGQVSEFYISNGKLYACYTEQTMGTGTNDEAEEEALYYNYVANTCVKTFDISNPEEPKEIAKVSQSGDYDTVRIVGDYMYLISRMYVYDITGSADDATQYVPSVQGTVLEAGKIYMPSIEYGKQYTIISSINLNEPDQVCDTKALLSTSGMAYVSTESIYMCETIYSDMEDYNQTAIRKISYKDGELTAVGQTKVWGALNDSFSIDEYDGNLRLVTTVTPQVRYNYGIHPITTLRDFLVGDSTANTNDAEVEDAKTEEGRSDDSAIEEEATEDAYQEGEDASEKKDEKKETNALYILDAKLKQVSKLEGIAKDERIYSARFMGDTGYFVTYKQVDPLFSVDLSDPKNPEILGELKIPGFSEYLHPYSENLLLGIGMDTDEDGMTSNGVKLSMFDISNPANVTEINKQILKGMYGSDVFWNYKAVLIDAEKNLIGFSANGDSQHYYVYSYDDNSGFTCLMDRDVGNAWYGTIRGMYIGETLYIIEGYAIESYDLSTFDKIDDIVL